MTHSIAVTPLALLAYAIGMQCLLIGCILPLLVDGNRRANAFLSAFFFLLACRVVSYFLYFSDVSAPRWILFLPVFYSLAGPCLYYYVRLLAEPATVLGPKLLVHLWPLLVVVGVALSFWGGNTGDAGLYPAGESALPLARLNLVFDLVFLVYLAAAWKVVHRHQRDLKQLLSRIDAMMSLSWLNTLLLLLLLTWSCMLVIDVFRSLGMLDLDARAWAEQIAAQIFVLFIAIGGLRQRMISYEPLEQPTPASPTPGTDARAPEVSTEGNADAERVQRLWAKVEDYVLTEKPYLDNDLSLRQLAEALSSRPQLVSRAINTHAGSNFYDYINGLRITEAQELLSVEGDRRVNMLAISEAAGFNSQSTFYNHFKKRVGMTPKQYRARIIDRAQ